MAAMAEFVTDKALNDFDKIDSAKQLQSQRQINDEQK